jgi:hypothetical protein
MLPVRRGVNAQSTDYAVPVHEAVMTPQALQQIGLLVVEVTGGE